MRLLAVLSIFGPAILIAAVAGVALARRRRRLRPPKTGWLTDEMVHQIIARGRVEGPETTGLPLDLDAIRRAEDRFWRETWDAPEPYTD